MELERGQANGAATRIPHPVLWPSNLRNLP